MRRQQVRRYGWRDAAVEEYNSIMKNDVWDIL